MTNLNTYITPNYRLVDLVKAYDQTCFDASKEEISDALLGAEIAKLEFAIDRAIDAGDRYTFLALSGQLKELLAKVGEVIEV